MSQRNRQPKNRNSKANPEGLCDLGRMADERDSTDVLGSYTGNAMDGDRPIQDADDL